MKPRIINAREEQVVRLMYNGNLALTLLVTTNSFGTPCVNVKVADTTEFDYGRSASAVIDDAEWDMGE